MIFFYKPRTSYSINTREIKRNQGKMSVRVRKESTIDPQLVEVDSSTNSGEANSASETTRQSSLQRIQMRKEKVKMCKLL